MVVVVDAGVVVVYSSVYFANFTCSSPIFEMVLISIADAKLTFWIFPSRLSSPSFSIIFTEAKKDAVGILFTLHAVQWCVQKKEISQGVGVTKHELMLDKRKTNYMADWRYICKFRWFRSIKHVHSHVNWYFSDARVSLSEASVPGSLSYIITHLKHGIFVRVSFDDLEYRRLFEAIER